MKISRIEAIRHGEFHIADAKEFWTPAYYVQFVYTDDDGNDVAFRSLSPMKEDRARRLAATADYPINQQISVRAWDEVLMVRPGEQGRNENEVQG